MPPLAKPIVTIILFRFHLEVRETFVSQSGLCGNASKGKHGKTSVVDFFGRHVQLARSIHLVHVFGSELEVTGITLEFTLGHLDKSSASGHFDQTNSQEHDSHGSLFDQGVVGQVGGRNAGERFSGTRETKTKVASDPASNGHHCDTAVLDFGFSCRKEKGGRANSKHEYTLHRTTKHMPNVGTDPTSRTHPVDGADSISGFPRRRLEETSKVLGDRGQEERIESVVSGKSSIQSGGLGEERNRGGTLGLVHHCVPQTVRHGRSGGRRRLGRGGRSESGGRAGHNKSSSDGLHGQQGVKKGR